jgi:GNAT superfamily N-acetyltransferase
MLRNYAGVDPEFERVVGKGLYKLYMRWLWLPFYYSLFNRGYALRVGNELAGMLYLQHRKFVTHINDIEINKAFQGKGYSHRLLAFAEEEAHRRQKHFMTLAVTISNRRAVNLYFKTGYVSQHHHYFQFHRTQWEDPEPPTSEQKKIELQPLKGKTSKNNLRRFFEREMFAGVPDFAQVWNAYYAPTPSSKTNGLSLGIKWQGSDKEFSGHADFFRYYGRGRWRLYTAPETWATQQEKNLLEALIYDSRDYQSVSFNFGTSEHHNQLLEFMEQHGYQSRPTERMLMIKKLL